MKLKRLPLLIVPLAMLVLELLPNGVVLNFWNPEGEAWRETYSYFSLTPFGYANFGPFLTAILTCALTFLTLTCIFWENKRLMLAVQIVSGAAFVTSLAPLLFGIKYFTLIGIFISVLCLVELVYSLLEDKIFSKKQTEEKSP